MRTQDLQRLAVLGVRACSRRLGTTGRAQEVNINAAASCYDLLTDAGYTRLFTGRHSGAPQALQSPPRTCMGPSPLRLRGSPTQSAAIHRSFWIASMLHVPADAR
jgi:hypothetical protein